MPFLTSNNTLDLLTLDNRVNDANATFSGIAIDIRAMSTNLPGYHGEAGQTNIPKDGAAHTLLSIGDGATAAYYEIEVQPTSSGTAVWARLAIGLATSSSKKQWSTRGPFVIGPVASGVDTVSCLVDVTAYTSADVAYTRIS